MGLPVDVPLVLSGHQAELWHGGILAKHFASEAFAARSGAATAWLVVDQDEAEDPSLLVPVRDAAGQLRAWRWKWAEGFGRVAAAVQPVQPEEAKLEDGSRWALETVGARLAAVRAALRASAASSWSGQVSFAAAQLLKDAAPVPQFVYESRLASTELFRAVVGALARETAEAIGGYNGSIAGSNDSGMRALDQSLGELPLWSIKSGRRQRVLARDLPNLDPSTLAPRGMLMTALLRLAGCELFVHGLGGGAYDLATERWVQSWTGELARIAQDFGGGGAPAPMVVASADLRLPLATAQVATEQEIGRAVWLAHRARHDPALLNDAAAGRQKAAILEQIAAHKRAGETPAAAFAELHALLERARSQGAGVLGALEANAARLHGQRAEALLAFSRTWSFALQTPESIGAMFEKAKSVFA